MSLDENYKNFELILNSEITETKEQRCNVHVYNSNFYYPLTEVLNVSLFIARADYNYGPHSQ